MDLLPATGTVALLPALLAAGGIGQALAGLAAVRRFTRAAAIKPLHRPPVTLLKPLYGDEPLLEQALASVCAQDYPEFQIVFGVQDPNDPAIAVVDRLRVRFPQVAIDLVVNTAEHGLNRKIANLINMWPAARHDLLIIADSDLHCAPDYLEQVVAGFGEPGTGLVTTLYAGLAANDSLAARLGASTINHGFLPGALMSRDLGRQDCLGATMALRRETLAAIGGFEALVDHIADDNLLGRKVRARGLNVRLAATVPATTVPETDLDALFRHELRWSRTILSLVPFEFAISAIQYPLFWAALAWAIGGGAWFALLFAASWAARLAAAHGIDRALGLVRAGRATPVPGLLLPLRDGLSILVLLASYVSDKVEWRGQMMHTRRPETTAPPATQDTDRARARQGTVMS